MPDHLSAPVPSKARVKALIRYVERIKAGLFLSHWTITYQPEHPLGGDALASIDPLAGRYYATLRLGEGLFDETPEKFRMVMVHEMLHVSRFQSQMVIYEGAYKQALGQDAWDIFYGEYKRTMEYEVDLLATAIAEHFPLPPKWPK